MSLEQPTGDDMHRHETPVSAMTDEGLASGLAVVSIAKSYDKRAVLTDVSLSVAKGEVVGLLGPNGAGKTTCFNLLTKFLQPTSGSIHYKGVDVTQEGSADLARRGHPVHVVTRMPCRATGFSQGRFTRRLPARR